jgi:hypothetical protein
MKKDLSLFLWATLLLFSNCVDPNQGVVVRSISLNMNELELLVGEKSDALVATLWPANADNRHISWSSSDQSKATVDEYGEITAIAVGNVTITATANKLTATCEVHISQPANGISMGRVVPFLIAMVPHPTPAATIWASAWCYKNKQQ